MANDMILIQIGISIVLLMSILLARLVPSDRPFHESNISDLASNLTIVITGANSGLGFATVEHLARAGTSRMIVLACRNTTRCEDARKRASALLPVQSTTLVVTATLDLGSRSSIERFSKDLLNLILADRDIEDVSTSTIMQEPMIDVLINNAGIFSSNLEHNYIHGIEEHMHVNYLGHVLLTHLLWPTLHRSGARIVSVSSISAIFPTNPLVGWYPWDKQWSDVMSITSGLIRYFRSKRATLIFAHELHKRALNTSQGMDMRVSSVASHPGFSRSEIWFLNGAKCLPKFLSNMLFVNPLWSMSTTQGALTQLWAALDRASVPSGHYVGPRWWLYGKPIQTGPIKHPDVPLHQSPFSQESELWERTMEVLAINSFGQPNATASTI